MNLWSFTDGIIRHPPLVLLAILIAILVSHALKLTFEFISKRHQANSLIITLEIMVVIVLAYLAIHLQIENQIRGDELSTWHNEAFLMASLLVFFTLASILIYFLFKAVVPEHGRKK